MATYKSIKYIVPTEVVEHTDSINALADVDTSTTAPTEGQTIKWDGTNWVPSDIEEAAASSTQKAIFGFGYANDFSNKTNLVSSTGVVATDPNTSAGDTAAASAAGYGGDKAIFGFGGRSGVGNTSITNLVSNTGVMSSDVTGVGTARGHTSAAGFGGDKAIFGFGIGGGFYSITNLVSNAGVVASDTTGVGTARCQTASAGYGGDKALFGFGTPDFLDGDLSITNLVSNTGVVATDTAGVSGVKPRRELAASGYGGDKAIFGFGYAQHTYGYYQNYFNITNLVSNTGVVASDTTGVGTGRKELAAAGFGGDKAIFGFGNIPGAGTSTNVTNLVSNTGVVSSDQTGVGTARTGVSAAGYSTTA